MKFDLTPDEARKPAAAVIKFFKKKKMKIAVERPAWPGAPYRTTIVAEKSGLKILIEAQGVLGYGRSLQDFASWLAANRYYSEFSIATTNEATVEVGVSHQMKKDGVGLLIVHDDGSIEEHHRPRNPPVCPVRCLQRFRSWQSLWSRYRLRGLSPGDREHHRRGRAQGVSLLRPASCPSGQLS